MKATECEILKIPECYKPIVIETECDSFKKIFKEFMEAYTSNRNKPIEMWLMPIIKKYLPSLEHEEIQVMCSEIVNTLKKQECYKDLLQKDVKRGRTKEGWFSSIVSKIMSKRSQEDTKRYMNALDRTVREANLALHRTVTVQTGEVNKNPHLDGFIAEQHHTQTFNMNAVANGSKYRAQTLEPNGTRYAKNSPDIVIVDGKGRAVKKYQVKYYKDANATELAIKHGYYVGQEKLVPTEQNAEINMKTTDVLEAPDGTKSNPLRKEQAERMRDDVQSGGDIKLDWSKYNIKDLAMGIAKQASGAAVQGALIGAGYNIAGKLWNNEKIDGEEVIKSALEAGVDFGVKAAAAGALKVGIEKEIITVIPKGTPASTIANITFIAVENVKVFGRMAKGELSFWDGIRKLEQTTVSTLAGVVSMEEGTALGSTLGAIWGPVGAAVGGFIGGSIGYMAGSAVGEKIVNFVQKFRSKLLSVFNEAFSGMKKMARTILNDIKNVFSSN